MHLGLPLRRSIAWSPGRSLPVIVSFAALHLVTSAAHAGPAVIDLATQSVSPVIIGAQVPIDAWVYNTAAPGNDALNYSIAFDVPDGSNYLDSGTITANSGSTPDHWTVYYNTTNATFGVHTATVEATDTNTLNGKTHELDIVVLKHSTPGFYIQGVLYRPIDAPPPEPLAFGATGGGETASFAAPNVIADPPPSTPTAALDLDVITSVGDSQITIDLLPFSNLPADESPTSGMPWEVLVSTLNPGNFTTYFTLHFSDQNLLGATAPGSLAWTVRIDATVSLTGEASATFQPLQVPEPATLALLLPGVLMLRKRRRN